MVEFLQITEQETIFKFKFSNHRKNNSDVCFFVNLYLLLVKQLTATPEANIHEDSFTNSGVLDTRPSATWLTPGATGVSKIRSMRLISPMDLHLTQITGVSLWTDIILVEARAS